MWNCTAGLQGIMLSSTPTQRMLPEQIPIYNFSRFPVSFLRVSGFLVPQPRLAPLEKGWGVGQVEPLASASAG